MISKNELETAWHNDVGETMNKNGMGDSSVMTAGNSSFQPVDATIVMEP